MKAKSKLLLCILIFFLGAFFNLFFTTALHNLLSGKSHTLTFPSFTNSIASLMTSKQHGLLFLCLQGLVAVASIMYFVTNNRPYQSELTPITPHIETPVPVGQHQHGSSRWLTESEKQRAFDVLNLDLKHPLIQQLMDTGYDDLHFLNPNKEVNPDETSSEEYSESGREEP